jgi:hypothetical protein
VFYKHCCHSLITEDHTDYCLSRQEEIKQLRRDKELLRTAFIIHRTATHIVAPNYCETCKMSDRVLKETS